MEKTPPVTLVGFACDVAELANRERLSDVNRRLDLIHVPRMTNHESRVQGGSKAANG